jgi:hypothetical protein
VYRTPKQREDGKAICSRCGGLQGLRKDGRIKQHRVAQSAVVPMIRPGFASAGQPRGRRT